MATIFRRPPSRLVEGRDERVQIDRRCPGDDDLIRFRADQRRGQRPQRLPPGNTRASAREPAADPERLPLLQHPQRRRLRVAREQTERVPVEVERPGGT